MCPQWNQAHYKKTHFWNQLLWKKFHRTSHLNQHVKMNIPGVPKVAWWVKCLYCRPVALCFILKVALYADSYPGDTAIEVPGTETKEYDIYLRHCIQRVNMTTKVCN